MALRLIVPSIVIFSIVFRPKFFILKIHFVAIFKSRGIILLLNLLIMKLGMKIILIIFAIFPLHISTQLFLSLKVQFVTIFESRGKFDYF